MCEKGVKDFFCFTITVKKWIMLVADFSWHFNEACPIKIVNVKTKSIVKQSFNSLRPSSYTENKHATCIQFC